MEMFLIYALIAGSVMAIAAGPLGSVMLWRRLAYFGDAMGHTAILGISLGVVIGLELNITTFITVLSASLLFYYLYERKAATSDTLLGIIAQTGLSLGIITLAAFNTSSSKIMAFLFGDILSISGSDVIFIVLMAVMVIVLLISIWDKLLLLTFDQQTSLAENGKQIGVNIIFMLAIALFVSLAIKTTGILLITALLIIPSASCQHLSKNPEQMSVFASIFGLIAVLGGFALSYLFDIPTGPAIVIFAAFLCILLSFLKNR